ncbi:fimbria/pilus outer membrane usher protein [Edwardsiella tarda]|uniref:fimbria/pilus outer membrane usher protein n=1 Tax=Edwardsiella tarda TaxID=636 RepID=UPI000BE22F0A|nr:fimbria/pilus outer membrane usher protein [Edwardsiella tarda]ATI62981.1 porin [Edwardsiella tarda]
MHKAKVLAYWLWPWATGCLLPLVSLGVAHAEVAEWARARAQTLPAEEAPPMALASARSSASLFSAGGESGLALAANPAESGASRASASAAGGESGLALAANSAESGASRASASAADGESGLALAANPAESGASRASASAADGDSGTALAANSAESGASRASASAADGESGLALAANPAGRRGHLAFNTAFLQYYAGNADLSQFDQESGLMPGEWLADIYLNDEQVGRESVILRRGEEGGEVNICLSPALLRKLNLTDEAIDADALAEADCTPVSLAIPAATAEFDAGRQRLTLHIAQKYVQHSARGYVPPALWQDGSTAAFLGYAFNSYYAHNNGMSYNSQYLGINSGFNIAGWYLRHNGSLNRQSGSGSEYQSLNTWLQHDIGALGGRLLVGEGYTSGRLFDTLGYTGVSLVSDEQMLPASRRDYAPEIRGIARGNARVTVRQNGNLIYETSVPAGEFVIDDLYPMGYGGDLEVTVREADGRESTSLVPYAAVAELLRPGAFRYELVAGRYRTAQKHSDQPLYLLTWQQGISNLLTLYGGTQLSEGYRAFLGGGALSTPIGAWAFDVTHSDAHTGNQELTGQSYRVTYNKFLRQTGSYIALAAYRFSTQNYLDFDQAMDYRDWYGGVGIDPVYLWREKSRFSLSLSQDLPTGWGQLSASALARHWWHRSGADLQYQLGWSSGWRRVNWSLSASRSRMMNGLQDSNLYLSFSVALGDQHPLSLSSGFSRDGEGHYGEQLSLAGSLGERQQMSWNVGVDHNDYSGTTGSLNGQYTAPWTSLSANASIGSETRTVSAGLNGALVAHPRGVTFTPYSSDGYIVASAPGAAGAEVTSYPGLQLDYWGNAAIPLSSVYQRNLVTLDPTRVENVEMDSTMQSVVPRAGAVVLADFATRHGYALLLLPSSAEQGLPFGSTITDEAGNNMGIVGQGGLLYARVTETQGQLLATWSEEGKARTCVLPYRIEDLESSTPQRQHYRCERSQ